MKRERKSFVERGAISSRSAVRSSARTPGKTPNRRSFWLAASGVCCAGFALVFALLGTSARLPSCPFRALTGLYCPGCGSTRALRALLRGELVESLRYNPATAPFLAIVAVLGVLFFRDLWRGEFPYRRGAATFSLACLLFFLVFFILRNVPLPAFDLLRPPPTVCR